MDLVKPTKCRRCNGTGAIALASGGFGEHVRCDGTGRVEGDRATIKAQKEAVAARAEIVAELRALAASAKESHLAVMAADGLDMLRLTAPERHAKAVTSIRAGHPRVVLALAEYFNANR